MSRRDSEGTDESNIPWWVKGPEGLRIREPAYPSRYEYQKALEEALQERARRRGAVVIDFGSSTGMGMITYDGDWEDFRRGVAAPIPDLPDEFRSNADVADSPDAPS